MRQAFLVALLSFAAGVSALASQNETFIAAEIAQISTCGLTCLAETIPAVGCSLTNTTCQCSSSELVTLTGNCMLANCTFNEAIELSKIQAAICQLPFESRTKEMRIVTIVCAVVTYTSVLLRFISRLVLAQTYGMDDWFILGATIADAVFTYYGTELERDGFGNHLRDINLSVVPELLFIFYVDETLYLLTIGLVKVSILFFYLRVFPKKSFRILCWLMIAFCTANMLSFVLVTIFQCHPFQFAWKRTSIREGSCVNYNAAAWANAGVNILQDILIVILPMQELRSLQLSKLKKFGVYVMFGMGSCVCLTSIIRLNTLRGFGMTIDATYSNIPTTIWSTIETTAAIFCACLPAIRAGIAILFPKFMHTTLHKSIGLSTSRSRTAPAPLSKPTILVSQHTRISQHTITPTELGSRLTGIDLEPRFLTWTVVETALGPRSPRSFRNSDRDGEEDKMSFVSLVSSRTFATLERVWTAPRNWR